MNPLLNIILTPFGILGKIVMFVFRIPDWKSYKVERTAPSAGNKYLNEDGFNRLTLANRSENFTPEDSVF